MIADINGIPYQYSQEIRDGKIHNKMFQKTELSYKYRIPAYLTRHSTSVVDINTVDQGLLAKIRHEVTMEVAKTALNNMHEELVFLPKHMGDYELRYHVNILTDPERKRLEDSDSTIDGLKEMIRKKNLEIVSLELSINGYEQNIKHLNTFWNRLVFLFTNKI